MHLIALTVSVAGTFWLESRARPCGNGFVPANLPLGWRGHRFRGQFYISNDAEDVLEPDDPIVLRDAPTEMVDHISRYRGDDPLLVEVILKSGARAILNFRGSTPTQVERRTVEDSQEAKRLIGDPTLWTSVEIQDCGTVAVQQNALIAVTLVGLVTIGLLELRARLRQPAP